MNQPELAEEPSSGWAMITRIALIGCLLMIFGTLSVMLLPELSAIRKVDARIADLTVALDKSQRVKEKMENESVLLSEDQNFVEIKAREELGLKKPGETLFSFKD